MSYIFLEQHTLLHIVAWWISHAFQSCVVCLYLYSGWVWAMCVGMSLKYRQWCAGCGFPKSCRPPAHRTICGLTLLRSIHCSPCSYFNVAVEKWLRSLQSVWIKVLFFIVLRFSHIALIVFLCLKPSCPLIRIYNVYGNFDWRIVFFSCIKNYNMDSESGGICVSVLSVKSYPVLFYILKHDWNWSVILNHFLLLRW